MKKMVAWLPWKHMSCTHIPANFAACVVASNIIANCELLILFLRFCLFFVVEQVF